MEHKKILIAEDELIIAYTLKSMLEKLNFIVISSVTSSKEAISETINKKPDLILMDIFLSDDIDGITAVEEIHKKTNTPVIFLTASTDPSTVDRAKAINYSHLLNKPFDQDDLHKTIDQIFRF